MVLEWLEGATLEAVIGRREGASGLPLRTLREAVQLLDPAAEALALAHRKGIAHRDVKPGNVFVLGDPRGDCTVKLLDFGIAKVVSDAQKMAGSVHQDERAGHELHAGLRRARSSSRGRTAPPGRGPTCSRWRSS